MLGNTSYIGYPMVEALLGAQALPYAVVYDQFGTFVMLSTLGLVVLARYGGDDPPTARMIALRAGLGAGVRRGPDARTPAGVDRGRARPAGRGDADAGDAGGGADGAAAAAARRSAAAGAGAGAQAGGAAGAGPGARAGVRAG